MKGRDLSLRGMEWIPAFAEFRGLNPSGGFCLRMVGIPAFAGIGMGRKKPPVSEGILF